MARAAGTEEPTTDPYVLLVRALRDELGRERGWQARVADLLGVHPTYISKIDRGERLKVGRSVKVRAVARGVPIEALLPRDADRHEAVDFAALAHKMLADPERAGMAKTFKNIEMALPASAEARVWRTVAELLLEMRAQRRWMERMERKIATIAERARPPAPAEDEPTDGQGGLVMARAEQLGGCGRCAAQRAPRARRAAGLDVIVRQIGGAR